MARSILWHYRCCVMNDSTCTDLIEEEVYTSSLETATKRAWKRAGEHYAYLGTPCTIHVEFVRKGGFPKLHFLGT